MFRRHSAVLVAGAAVTALAVAGCGGSHPNHAPTSSSSASAPVTSAAPSGSATGEPAAAAVARALLPIQHHGAHPGAAALHGDVRHVPKAAVIPSVKNAPSDNSGSSSCQIGQRAQRPRYCTYGDKTAPTHTIALIGDSVAGEWLIALNKIAKAHRWKIVLSLHSRCPWTAAMTVNLGTTVPYRTCYAWGVSVLHALLTKIHPTVVITSDRPVLGTPGHTPGATASRKIGRGMATYWHRLIAHHIGVVAIRESPEMGFSVPYCLAHASVSSCSVARSSAVAHTTPITTANRLVGHGERMFDLTNLICGAHTCRPIVGNVVVYRDFHHLTGTYALTTAPYLERMLLKVPKLAAP